MKATRCFFELIPEAPFFKEGLVEFDYVSGRDQRTHLANSEAMSLALGKTHPKARRLEVSTASDCSLGVMLSALNLRIETKWGKFSLERVYQSSKVFERGGPFREILLQQRNPKSLPMLKESGKLIGFEGLDGMFFPANGTSDFYDRLYLSALVQNPALLTQLADYDLFTDLRFSKNHLGFSSGKPFNTQARSCAIASSLMRIGGAEELSSFLHSRVNAQVQNFIQPPLF